ncbi:TATA element modulatory factor 1 [Irineochytrium annulatum]|nr:TATA element modulatory factor 1 [Irineochytrium annulatum]
MSSIGGNKRVTRGPSTFEADGGGHVAPEPVHVAVPEPAGETVNEDKRGLSAAPEAASLKPEVEKDVVKESKSITPALIVPPKPPVAIAETSAVSEPAVITAELPLSANPPPPPVDESAALEPATIKEEVPHPGSPSARADPAITPINDGDDGLTSARGGVVGGAEPVGTGNTPDGKLLSTEVLKLTAVVEERERQLLKAMTENASLTETANVLRAQLEQLERTKADENEKVDSLIKEFTDRLGASEKQLHAAAKERDSLKQQLMSTQGSAQGSHEEMIRQLTERDEKIKDLLMEGRVTARKRCDDIIAGEKLSKNELKMSNIVKKLRAKEGEVDKEVRELTKKLELAESKVTELKERVAWLAETEKRLNDTLRTVNDVNEKQAKQIVQFENQLQLMKDETGQLNTSKFLTVELQASRERQESSRLSAELEARNAQVETFEKTISDLSAKLDLLKSSHVRAMDEAKESFESVLARRIDEEKRLWEERRLAEDRTRQKEIERLKLRIDLSKDANSSSASTPRTGTMSPNNTVLAGAPAVMATKTRDELAEELLKATSNSQGAKDLEVKLAEAEKEKAQLNNRFMAALELLGEKTEQVEELKADMEDVRNVYKTQVEDLLKENARLKASRK